MGTDAQGLEGDGPLPPLPPWLLPPPMDHPPFKPTPTPKPKPVDPPWHPKPPKEGPVKGKGTIGDVTIGGSYNPKDGTGTGTVTIPTDGGQVTVTGGTDKGGPGGGISYTTPRWGISISYDGGTYGIGINIGGKPPKLPPVYKFPWHPEKEHY